MQRLCFVSLVPFFAACLVLFSPSRASAQVTFKVAGLDHVDVIVNGQRFSSFYIGANYPKPFLAPLRAPTGQIVTRKFPMEIIPGETRDHPHHRGLFIGYGDINGLDFWANEPESPSPNKGRFATLRPLETKSGRRSGTLTVALAWQDPRGATLMEELRTLTFYADAEQRTIDVESVLTARKALRFADTKEGFFAIRLADSLSEQNGGLMSNAEGAQTEKNVWGKRSDWVDYDGSVDGQKLGILIFDHPSNPNHPPRWHARAYGLFAVNPFGLKDFDTKATEPGGMSLNPGESLRFRWRVIIHRGDVPMKEVSQWFINYKKVK